MLVVVVVVGGWALSPRHIMLIMMILVVVVAGGECRCARAWRRASRTRSRPSAPCSRGSSSRRRTSRPGSTQPPSHAVRGAVGVRERSKSWMCMYGSRHLWWSLAPDPASCVLTFLIICLVVVCPISTFCVLTPLMTWLVVYTQGEGPAPCQGGRGGGQEPGGVGQQGRQGRQDGRAAQEGRRGGMRRRSHGGSSGRE